jgi:hypothetical protein
MILRGMVTSTRLNVTLTIREFDFSGLSEVDMDEPVMVSMSYEDGPTVGTGFMDRVNVDGDSMDGIIEMRDRGAYDAHAILNGPETRTARDVEREREEWRRERNRMDTEWRRSR